ncbi:hypothetical protein P8A18_09110 [Streptomyces castrisilvae]|uniref:Molecular chaperone DnaJ n=1 Tax=Streptomyces castrisilvae TaxID=3033811 RepID=A0ABY9HGE9_9ACTN|nr:hypothetical protein [Streptomyces sp. Mut1]WLQ33603.1 hypothetical protein P8A18_09110 [Streptomyces sp. Mut1]
MAPRRTTPEPPPVVANGDCKPCGGTGNVPTTVRVGRKRRPVGQQDGLCLNCFGTGTDPDA